MLRRPGGAPMSGWISLHAINGPSLSLIILTRSLSIQKQKLARAWYVMKALALASPSSASWRNGISARPAGWRIRRQHGSHHQAYSVEPRIAEIEVTEGAKAEVLQQIPEAPQGDSSPGMAVMSAESASKVLAISLLGFAAVAGDVFSPASLHLLAPFDQGAHAWVVQNVPYDFQAFTARKLISDAFIVVPFLAWIYAAVIAAQPGPPPRDLSLPQADNGGSSSSSGGLRGSFQPTAYALFLSAFVYNLGGAIKHGDPAAVALVKYSFQRPRPLSEIYTTFSFPSGHTTAAVLITGLALFLLLPLAAQQQQEQQQAQRGGQQGNGSNGSSGSTVSGTAGPSSPGAHRQIPAWQRIPLRYRIPLWVASAGVTAMGRVLGDMHWVSDTLGGACFGAALVSGAVLTWHLLAGSREHDDSA